MTLIKDANIRVDENKKHDYNVKIKAVNGVLCNRCRRHVATLRDDESDICYRCSDVLLKISSRTKSSHKSKTVV